jgi:hypothetical protein
MTAVVGPPPLFVAGGAGCARDELLPPPQADSIRDEDSAKNKLSLACIKEFLVSDSECATAFVS